MGGAGSEGEDEAEAVSLPLDGRLDLHLFRPKDVPELLDSYLVACRAAGVLTVEVVHGKGTGTLRRRVRTLLEGRTDVHSVRTAEETRGGWGVTLVTLLPPPQG